MKKQQNVLITRGSLVLPGPLTEDEKFKYTVMFVADIDTETMLTFTLNKITDKKINDLVPDFPPFDARFYEGGPIEDDKFFYVHKLGDKLRGSIHITEDLYWSGDYDHLKLLIETHQVEEDEIRFYIGYSVWELGYIEMQMAEEQWLFLPEPPSIHEYIFSKTPRDLWKKVFSLTGESSTKFIAHIPIELN